MSDLSHAEAQTATIIANANKPREDWEPTLSSGDDGKLPPLPPEEEEGDDPWDDDGDDGDFPLPAGLEPGARFAFYFANCEVTIVNFDGSSQ